MASVAPEMEKTWLQLAENKDQPTRDEALQPAGRALRAGVTGLPTLGFDHGVIAGSRAGQWGGFLSELGTSETNARVGSGEKLEPHFAPVGSSR